MVGSCDSLVPMNARKPLLVLQLRPEDDTSDNEFEAILKYGELSADDTVRMRIERSGIPDLSLDDYSAVLVGGSPFDISTPPHDKSAIQLKIERDFMRLFDQIIPLDFPFLGACSGCGLLGSYLKSPISGRYRESVGCPTVRLTEAGRAEPLLEGFPEQIDVLCGHKEACDELPRGATLLLRGEACPVQMFRVGENVYATQFHPEADREGFEVRVRAYRDHGYFPAAEADALVASLRGKEAPYGHEILRRFVARHLR